MSTVGELGERQLIRLLRSRLDLSMVGDDAALLEDPAPLAVTVDSFVEGVHFHRGWCSPAILGRRLLEAALSDLAASGAEPRWLFSAVHLPRELPVEWLLNFYLGLTAREDCRLAGGETVRAHTFSITLTAVGPVRGPFFRRSAAVPGERLWVTGPLGRSLDAPALLEKGKKEPLTAMEREQVDLFLNPRARFDAVGLLVREGCRAAIDISDGLFSEARHLALESGVQVELEPDRVPLTPYARGRFGEACSAGEDFELLFTAPADREFPGFFPIGVIRAGEGVVLRGSEGVVPAPSGGYDHFMG